MMQLRWRQEENGFALRWRGLGQHASYAALADPPKPLAAIIGPPGEQGPAGDQGPQGPAFDISSSVIDAGTFN